jgi:hypothetical protein
MFVIKKVKEGLIEIREKVGNFIKKNKGHPQILKLTNFLVKGVFKVKMVLRILGVVLRSKGLVVYRRMVRFIKIYKEKPQKITILWGKMTMWVAGALILIVDLIARIISGISRGWYSSVFNINVKSMIIKKTRGMVRGCNMLKKNKMLVAGVILMILYEMMHMKEIMGEYVTIVIFVFIFRRMYMASGLSISKVLSEEGEGSDTLIITEINKEVRKIKELYTNWIIRNREPSIYGNGERVSSNALCVKEVDRLPLVWMMQLLRIEGLIRNAEEVSISAPDFTCKVTGIEKIVKNIHIRGYSTSRDDAEALQIREESFTRLIQMLKQVPEKSRKKGAKSVSNKKKTAYERIVNFRKKKVLRVIPKKKKTAYERIVNFRKKKVLRVITKKKKIEFGQKKVLRDITKKKEIEFGLSMRSIIQMLENRDAYSPSKAG